MSWGRTWALISEPFVLVAIGMIVAAVFKRARRLWGAFQARRPPANARKPRHVRPWLLLFLVILFLGY